MSRKPLEIKIGDKYGKYKIISESYSTPKGRKVNCQCECGKIVVVTCSELKRITSCKQCMGKGYRKYKSGDVKGCLTVIDYIGSGVRKIKVQCKCGHTYTMGTHTLDEVNKCRICYKKEQNPGCKHQSYKGLEFVSKTYFSQVKKGAKSRNLELSISLEDINNLLIQQNHKCCLTGLPIAIGNSTIETTASLDRINSDLGYTLNNIQWIHKDVNKMKMDFNQDKFIKLCKLIANN
jgi:hypothetical protein